jgi:signal transduction histidine kinase
MSSVPDGRSETRLQGWWRSIDSLRLRTALVVLFGISLVHFGSLFTYHQSLEKELDLANEVRLADQLLTIKRSVMRAPLDEREDVAHDFSGGSIDAHWGSTPYAVEGDTAGQNWEPLRRNLRALAPEIAEDGLIIGPDNQTGDDPHLAVVSIKLPDASWINVNLVSWDRKVPPPGGMLVSTTLMALGAVVVSMLLVRWFTRPLTAVATAAKDFYRGKTVVPVAEKGPREVVELAVAFNDMQRRIERLIEDRTQALAAVSHDLKTPITRLRFRAEDLADGVARDAMAEDLTEMERMLDQTLSFLRGDRSDEELKPIDIVAILETLVDDAVDRGASVELSGAAHAIITGRRLALKRAFSNLIENALKYGERARVEVIDQQSDVVVTISDEGPGIAAENIERALSPFVRLEPSRNLETGGFGLGLPIAQAILDGHSGTLRLENGQTGGLVVSVILPKDSPKSS